MGIERDAADVAVKVQTKVKAHKVWLPNDGLSLHAYTVARDKVHINTNAAAGYAPDADQLWCY